MIRNARALCKRGDLGEIRVIQAEYAQDWLTEDLENRIGNITVAYTREKKPIYAKDLKAQGPMTVLLKEAIRPNITQTLENNPAIIHGGPFC